MNELSEKEKKCYEFHFRHFSLRLSERYNLLISFEDYVLLSKMPYILKAKRNVRNDGHVAMVGFISYNEQKVRVIRGIGKITPLLTALPLK